MTKKKMITSIEEYYDIKSVISEKVFKEKYTVSNNVTCTLLAEGAVVRVCFEDSRMPTTDEMEEIVRRLKM